MKINSKKKKNHEGENYLQKNETPRSDNCLQLGSWQVVELGCKPGLLHFKNLKCQVTLT